MKNILLEFLLLIVSFAGFGQQNGYQYIPDKNPTLKVEQLSSAKTIHDLNPDFCRFLTLPAKQQLQLDDRLNRKKLFFTSSIRPLGSYLEHRQYLQNDFDRIIQYEMVEIQTIHAGKTKIANGTTEKLTAGQRANLISADPESTIRINIRFVYKNPPPAPGEKTETIEGMFQIRLVPDSEAEFPGGEKPMIDYFQNQVSAKIARLLGENIPGVTRVSFTVNEKGQVENPVIDKPAANSKISKIILDAIKAMPKWNPAKNAKGQPIKQEFLFGFGQNGGC